MTKTRPELTALLDELEGELPKMILDNPDPADFWPAFSGQADYIEDAAGAGDDVAYVGSRLDGMLKKNGMNP